MKKTFLLLFLSAFVLMACKGGGEPAGDFDDEETEDTLALEKADPRAALCRKFDKQIDNLKQEAAMDFEKPEYYSRDLFVIMVNRNNQILASQNGSPQVVDTATLMKMIKQFLNPDRPDNPSLPRLEAIDISGLGSVNVSHGCIALNVEGLDVPASVKNSVVEAILQLRDEASMKYFSQHYVDLSKEKLYAIGHYIPMVIVDGRVAEAPAAPSSDWNLDMREIEVVEEPIEIGYNNRNNVQVVEVEAVEEDEDDRVFSVVEQDPEFPGGMEALYRYIAENIKYPQLARDNGITGKVYVTFVVEKDGSISLPRILRDIGGGCGAEAVRVVKAMPKWKPGKQRGKPVRVQFNLPVNFTLQ